MSEKDVREDVGEKRTEGQAEKAAKTGRQSVFGRDAVCRIANGMSHAAVVGLMAFVVGALFGALVLYAVVRCQGGWHDRHMMYGGRGDGLMQRQYDERADYGGNGYRMERQGGMMILQQGQIGR